MEQQKELALTMKMRKDQVLDRASDAIAGHSVGVVAVVVAAADEFDR